MAADPGYALGLVLAGGVRRRMSQCTSAIAAYRRYIALEPDKSEPYYGLGLCLRETGDRPGAIEALKHYVAHREAADIARWVEQRARHPHGAGRERRACAATPPLRRRRQRARRERASRAGAKPAAGAGSDRQRLRRGAGAARPRAASTRRSPSISRRSPPIRSTCRARAALGELLLKVHRDDEAIEVFRAALDKNPTFAPALYDLAFALRVRDRPAEAVDAYQRYIKLRPSDPDAYYGLGRALQHLGRKADARKAYQTYVVDGEAPHRAALGRGGAGAARSRSLAAAVAARQATGVSSGRSRVKVAPRPASLSTVSVPPCATAICRPM